MPWRFNPFTGNLDEAAIPAFSGEVTLGSAASPSIFFSGDTNTGIYSPGANQLALSTNGTGRLFVDANGRVGVGQSTWTGYGAGSVSLGIKQYSVLSHQGLVVESSSDGSSLTLGHTGSVAEISAYYGASGSYSPIAFKTSNLERLRITEAGLVGIGTSSPSNKLDVVGVTQVYDSRGTSGYDSLKFIGGSAADFPTIEAVSATSPLYFKTNSNVRMAITSAGNVGIGTTSPSGKFHVSDANNSYIYTSSTNNSVSGFSGCYTTTGFDVGSSSNHPLTFYVNNAGRARIDTSGTFRVNGAGTLGVTDAVQLNGSAPANSLLLDASGRLLVGTASARTVEYDPGTTGVPKLQVESADGGSSQILITDTRVDGRHPQLAFLKTRDDAIVADDDILGSIGFFGDDGLDTRTWGGRITCEVDGTPGANDMPGRLVFSTTADGASSPTERMSINNAGQLFSFSTDNTATVATSQAAGTAFILIRGRHSATTTTNGTNVFYVYSNGNVANTNNSYGAISDIKLKENIVDASSQWDDIKALQVRNYNFKEGQTHTQIGLVAQEVELVSPGLVSESPDRDEDGNDLGTVTKSVNYSVLYMKAVKALQEAMERIETLEAKVAALESA